MKVRRSLSVPTQENLLGSGLKPLFLNSRICEREAWPAQGIREDSHIDDYTWGYLYIDENGSATFDESAKPARAEILLRWGHYVKENTIE